MIVVNGPVWVYWGDLSDLEVIENKSDLVFAIVKSVTAHLKPFLDTSMTRTKVSGLTDRGTIFRCFVYDAYVIDAVRVIAAHRSFSAPRSFSVVCSQWSIFLLIDGPHIFFCHIIQYNVFCAHINPVLEGQPASQDLY